jgi:hypothetical protein
MNHPYRFLFPAPLAICLGLLGSGSWVTAQERGEVVELGKLKSRVPADWARERPDDPSSYRQYRLEAVGGDKDDARLTIDFLGKGSSDSAEKQVQRWKALFLPPQGKKLDAVAKVRKLNVRGAAVTYLDVRGDYKGIPGNPDTPRQNYRLLGVYFATPQGPYVIRLFGPAETVEYYRQEFEDWVKAFK